MKYFLWFCLALVISFVGVGLVLSGVSLMIGNILEILPEPIKHNYISNLLMSFILSGFGFYLTKFSFNILNKKIIKV